MIVVLALAAAAQAAPAQPAPSAEPPSVRIDNLSPVAMFALADRARAANRIDDAIGFYDALSHDPNPDVRAEARFRKGMMLAGLRHYRDAAVAFRALLDEKPDAVRARLELARMLAAIGDEAAARRELRQAEATGLPPNVAVTVGQFDRSLRSLKRYGGSFEVALAPDTNINRATRLRTLDTIIAPITLSDDARSKSGVGVHVAGQGYERLRLADNLTLIPRASMSASLFRRSEFDDVATSALAGLEWQRKQDRITPSVGRTWRWYGNKLYARTDVATLDWLHVLGRRAQLVASSSISHAAYLQNGLQTGTIGDLSISVERAVSARAGGSLTLSVSRQSARDPAYATWSGGASGLGWRELGKTTVFFSAGLRRTEGDAALFLFGDRRRDWLITARAGATFRALTVKSFAPYVRVSFERNASSLQIYNYSRIATEIGITRAF